MTRLRLPDGPSERGRRPNLQNGCPAERGRPEIYAVEHQAEPAGTELFLVPSRGSQPSPDIGSPRAASPDGAAFPSWLALVGPFATMAASRAGVTQLAECLLPKH